MNILTYDKTVLLITMHTNQACVQSFTYTLHSFMIYKRQYTYTCTFSKNWSNDVEMTKEINK